MNPFTADFAIINVGQLVRVPANGDAGELGIVANAALAARRGRIVWLGASTDLRRGVALLPNATVLDAKGCLVTPGFVDSHTHIVYAGQRAAEFHERLSGISYTEQLGAGRGIHSTVAATRQASADELLRAAARRLHGCLAHGSTTGYGLDAATEARMLDVIDGLRAANGPRVVSTFMGAHVVPLEHRADRTAYLRLLEHELLPAFRGRTAFCDVFCEDGAFSVEESRALLLAAKRLGYKLKLHANQLAASGGALLAAELEAVSADHLDHVDQQDLFALAKTGVVATLLPGCSMTLRAAFPSAKPFLQAGVPLALATDFNPGTCACENMQLMVALAVLNMDMTVEQAIRAATLGGAQALAMHHEVGSLEIGKRADLVLWDAEGYLELGYRLGTNLARTVVVDGRVVLEVADVHRSLDKEPL
jgi:imidazolonepropionase